MDLIHCIYRSTNANPELNDAHLQAILDASRRNNAANEVTGMLLYDAGTFFQVLEGERATVEKLYRTIAADPRHDGIVKIIEEPIEERTFGEWTMGYPQLDAAELRELPGLNDVFTKERSLLAINECRAKALLKAFKQGKWRTKLH